jgi:hypothetical protein
MLRWGGPMDSEQVAAGQDLLAHLRPRRTDSFGLECPVGAVRGLLAAWVDQTGQPDWWPREAGIFVGIA